MLVVSVGALGNISGWRPSDNEGPKVLFHFWVKNPEKPWAASICWRVMLHNTLKGKALQSENVQTINMEEQAEQVLPWDAQSGVREGEVGSWTLF